MPAESAQAGGDFRKHYAILSFDSFLEQVN